MSAKFVNVDRSTPLLLRPDLRDWLPSNHLAHFVVDLVDALVPLSFSVNWKGTGSAQYPPSMMCALLIYSYVTGRFSSRVIERASYDDVAVRFVTGDTHPDHDTICTFRRVNAAAFSELFVNVLETAQQMDVLKNFGTVSQSVTDEANDKNQLVPVTEAIVSTFTPETVLADSGYNNKEAIDQVEVGEDSKPTGTIVLVPAERKHHHRTVKDLEKPVAKPAKKSTAGEAMNERMQQPANREAYKQRKQTVEPVFGIIKEAMGFRRFSMRGKHKAADECTVVTWAYNVKRLFHIGVSFAPNRSDIPKFATTWPKNARKHPTPSRGGETYFTIGSGV